jgi:hypothetical protein
MENQVQLNAERIELLNKFFNNFNPHLITAVRL